VIIIIIYQFVKKYLIEIEKNEKSICTVIFSDELLFENITKRSH